MGSTNPPRLGSQGLEMKMSKTWPADVAAAYVAEQNLTGAAKLHDTFKFWVAPSGNPAYKIGHLWETLNDGSLVYVNTTRGDEDQAPRKNFVVYLSNSGHERREFDSAEQAVAAGCAAADVFEAALHNAFPR